MQRRKAILIGGVGVGAVGEQQPGALAVAALASLVQCCGAPRSQLHVGASLQQVPEAVSITAAGRNVQRGGELLLVGQRP